MKIQNASAWSYHPYLPPMFDRGDILITRIVPSATAIHIEWLGSLGCRLYLSCRGEEPVCVGETTGSRYDFTGLESDVDYQFFLESGGKKSLVRLARTGVYPGTLIHYLHPEDGAYAFSGRFLCSPTVIRTPEGALLASMDLFEGNGAQNFTLIYRSEDDGATWQWQCDLMPCFWGKLFVWRNKVYMLACSTEHGDILIGRSDDDGRTFCTPSVLMRGSGRPPVCGPDMSPEPPIEYSGRLWCNTHWGSWQRGIHHPCVFSIAAEDDLLDVSAWTISDICFYDESWPGTAKGSCRGTLEGTFLIGRDRGLYMLCRYQINGCVPNRGLAMMYKIHTEDPGAAPEFYRVIPFDGNASKFTVKYDEATDRYYSIITRTISEKAPTVRNLISLVESEDGFRWKLKKDLIDFRDKDPAKNGLQYVDFIIEGGRIAYVCRTAVNGADSFHNSNCTVFDWVGID